MLVRSHLLHCWPLRPFKFAHPSTPILVLRPHHILSRDPDIYPPSYVLMQVTNRPHPSELFPNGVPLPAILSVQLLTAAQAVHVAGGISPHIVRGTFE